MKLNNSSKANQQVPALGQSAFNSGILIVDGLLWPENPSWIALKAETGRCQLKICDIMCSNHSVLEISAFFLKHFSICLFDYTSILCCFSMLVRPRLLRSVSSFLFYCINACLLNILLWLPGLEATDSVLNGLL